MDHGLNYPLGDDVITRQSSSSTVSSLSSITSPLHLSDITTAPQPPASTAVSQPRPAANSKASPLASTQPHPHLAYSSSSCIDTATQTVVHTGVQTEFYHTTPVTTIPVQPSQQSVTSLAVSSQEYSKMEQLMATALLNAKDTINTIETLSQSLLLKNVSREASLTVMPPGSYSQHVTYSQDVTNNPVVSMATVQDVVNNPVVVNMRGVTNNPAVVNTHSVTNKPVVTITQEQSANTQENDHLQSTLITPPSSSHANHMATPPQHNYTLYNDVTHLTEDDSYRLVTIT